MRVFPVEDWRRQRYERSATHQEIELGALSVDDADQHVYCYFRSTRGLPEGAEAARHKDVRHGEPDPDASAHQALLQAGLKRRLPPDHIYEWQAEWRDGELTSDLVELCRRVEDDLKATIDVELSAFEQVPSLERERDAHRAFASERAAHFVGRQDLLQQIESYLGSDDRRPLVVYGGPGAGTSGPGRPAGEFPDPFDTFGTEPPGLTTIEPGRKSLPPHNRTATRSSQGETTVQAAAALAVT